MIAKRPKDIRGLIEAGKVAAETLSEMSKRVSPGTTTIELDRIADGIFARYGAESAPRYFYNFPGATCISIAPVAAHGIPGDCRIQEGDLVNIDVSVVLKGFCADTGMTIAVEPVTEAAQKVCETATIALAHVIQTSAPGMRVSDIGRMIETTARDHGMSTIKNLSGHGLGKKLHEPPRNILNFFAESEKTVLAEGQVIAVEPFISSNDEYVQDTGDGWGLTASEGVLVAQYEHTLILMKGETIITTRRA